MGVNRGSITSIFRRGGSGCITSDGSECSVEVYYNILYSVQALSPHFLELVHKLF
jgi:hypothetical protein